MTSSEYQAQEVVADVIVDRVVEIRHLRPSLKLVCELFVLARQHLVSAQVIERAMLGSGHEPGARVMRHARLRPLLERGHEGILREFFGHADVANDARQTGNEPGRLDPPDRFDHAMYIGSRHCYRSHHLPRRDRKPRRATIVSRPATLAELRLHVGIIRGYFLGVGGEVGELQNLPDLDHFVV